MIREAREDRHLSQQELADLVGVAQGTICRAEQGWGSIELLQRISEALRFTPEEKGRLFDWAAHQVRSRREAA